MQFLYVRCIFCVYMYVFIYILAVFPIKKTGQSLRSPGKIILKIKLIRREVKAVRLAVYGQRKKVTVKAE